MQNEMNKIVKTLRKTLRAKVSERDRFEREMRRQLREFDQGISRIRKSIDALAPSTNGAKPIKGKERVLVDTTTHGKIEMSKRRYFVLKTLVEYGALSARAIQEVARKEYGVDLVLGTIRASLTRLRKSGIVTQASRGLWTVAE